VLETAVGGLVDVRPGSATLAFKLFAGERKRDVDAVCVMSAGVPAGPGLYAYVEAN
jgi:hypothetical protein